MMPVPKRAWNLQLGVTAEKAESCWVRLLILGKIMMMLIVCQLYVIMGHHGQFFGCVEDWYRRPHCLMLICMNYSDDITVLCTTCHTLSSVLGAILTITFLVD